eukprot:335027-Prymnesium_polylepis.1
MANASIGKEELDVPRQPLPPVVIARAVVALALHAVREQFEPNAAPPRLPQQLPPRGREAIILASRRRR